MIDHVKDMCDAGISGLKIEGRMKSAYYAAVVTNAYRHAIDAAVGGFPLSVVWREEVHKVSHREYSTGFYFNDNGPGQFYGNAMYHSVCDVVAVVESCEDDGSARLTQRNKFNEGDQLELLTPVDEPILFTARQLFDADGCRIDSTPHPMMEFRLKLPIFAQRYSLLRKYREI
jgi:putative protease